MEPGPKRVVAGLEMFDTAPVGAVLTSGRDHVVTYTNRMARRIFGDLPLGEPLRPVPGAPIPLARYRDRFDRVEQRGERALLNEVPALVPEEMPRQRWFDVSLAPIAPLNVEPGVLAIASDVTHRILQARQISILGEERRRIALRNTTLGRLAAQLMFVTDGEGSAIEPSPGWEAITGQAFDEFRGDGWLAMVHPEDRDRTYRSWRRAVEEVPSYWTHVYRLRTSNGDYRHVQARAVPVRDAQGRVLEWVGTCTDIEDELQDQFRERLLARAAAATSGRSDLPSMLSALAHVLVPEIVDACRVYLVRETPSRPPGDILTIELVGMVVRQGLPAFRVARQEQRGPGSPLHRAVRDRRPAFATFPHGDPPPDIGSEALRQWLADTNAACLAVVPIIVDGTVAAAASVSVSGERPMISEADVRLIEEIFEKAHDALSAVIRDSRTRQYALAIQHSLLTDPPDIPGLEIAGRYQSTVHTAGVGGDWYDCFLLPDRTAVLTVGDVAGHDVPAAAMMGQLRTVLRGVTIARPGSTAEILTLLNEAMESLYADSTATCALAKLSPDRSDEGGVVMQYSLAGHPPPLLFSGDGYRFLEDGRNPLLGAPFVRPYAEAEEYLRRGSTLLFYTDGLIERRGEHLGVGLARLGEAAVGLASEPVDTICEKLLSDLPVTGHDDVAMIALRVVR